MTRHFATLFDHRYAAQGLALYESLKKHSSEEFTLYVLPLDDETRDVLKSLYLPNVSIVKRDWFEAEMDLAKLKATRTYQEWCWTLASQLTEFLISKAGIAECTYLDSDLFTFADMEPVFDEIGIRSIAITPHQFPDNPEKPRLQKSGIYNVGFIHFKNTEAGKACLEQWAAQVRDRCSAEVGCGDQGYLDFFEGDFGSEVCILGHGVNTGPWNLMAYDVTERDGHVYLGDSLLLCYHMHEYRHGVRLTNYPLRDMDRDIIYRPYVEACNASLARIAALADCDKADHIESYKESRSVEPSPTTTVSLLYG